MIWKCSHSIDNSDIYWFLGVLEKDNKHNNNNNELSSWNCFLNGKLKSIKHLLCSANYSEYILIFNGFLKIPENVPS